jgi:hypothetical protein
MKKMLLVGLCACGILSVSAQSGPAKTSRRYLGIPYALELLYGYSVYQSAFFKQVNTFNAFRFNRPVKIAGLQSSDFAYNFGPYAYKGTLGFYVVLPEAVIVNDSTTSILSGFSFSMDLFTRVFYKKSPRHRLKLGLGFATGQLKFSENVNQKNPFFAPQFSLTYTYRIKKIALCAGAAYFYDVSDPGWKNTHFKTELPVEVATFKQTGFRINLGLGWRFC